MTDKQLLLLNNILYLGSDNMSKDFEGMSVSDILRTVDKNDLKKLDSFLTPEEDWKTIIDGMSNDPDISELVLYDLNTDVKSGKMACFETPSGEAVVVFEGTASNIEWKDNLVGGFETDTTQQQAALKWLEDLPYEGITVTGHSKGGNKAQYAALLSDKVDRCVSYDGQGFSKEFIEKYRIEIETNRDKIISYALDNDYVNILLNDISGKKIYLEGQNVDWFLDNHCPDAAFYMDENGQMQIREGSQSEGMKKFEVYLDGVLNALPDEDRKGFLGDLGDFLQIVTDDKNLLEKIIGGGWFFFQKGIEGVANNIFEFISDAINGTLIERVLSDIRDRFNFICNLIEEWANPNSFGIGKNIYGESREFAINVTCGLQSAEEMRHISGQMSQMMDSINGIGKSLLHLESSSFRTISKTLGKLETQIDYERNSIQDMSDVLKNSSNLYKRTEKRIITFT